MRNAALSRRHLLGLLAGTACAGLARPAVAAETRIARLIAESGKLPTVAERIDYISRAFIGTPYRGYTLIGGPKKPEKFVVRDDAFDCVTFCETVLAAARVSRAADFDAALRRIRYREGEIDWRERNHYFSDWCEFNIANGVCRNVAMPGGVAIDKPLTYERGLEPRQASFVAIPRASFLAHLDRIATGDIIGFLSDRPGLDYYHTGFVIADAKGRLWLRHAALSRRRVVNEDLMRFVAANRVKRVSVLRPQEPWAGDGPV